MVQRYGTSSMPVENGCYVRYTDFEALEKERNAPRAALTSGTPLQQFAIVVDRNYEGEGISLAVWNGENYSFTDGDCYDREGDTLDGYDTEWLTDYQLEQLVKTARAKEQA